MGSARIAATDAAPVRAVLTLVGAVALVAGLWGVATGIDGMAGDSAGTANVDSEIRFFAVLWAAYGAVVLRTAPRAQREPIVVRALMLVLFCAGVSRAISWADEGRPDTVYVILLALELTVPPLVLWLQARAPARRA